MARDLTAEFLAAATASRLPDATLTERGEAWDQMEALYAEALSTGVDLDPIELDEQARVALYGTGYPYA